MVREDNVVKGRTNPHLKSLYTVKMIIKDDNIPMEKQT